MTINSQVRTAGPYAGDGVSRGFPFGFKVFVETDILVARTDSGGLQTDLVLGTDYLVALNADQNAAPGGSVALVSALAVGYSLTITSDVMVIQPVDLTNQGGFYPQVIEDALDRLTILLQQQGGVGLGQTLRVPEVGGVQLLPAAADRALRLIAFDSSGNVVVSVPAAGDASGLALDLLNTLSTAKGDALIGVKKTATGAVARTGHQTSDDFFTPADFGAVSNGADDTAALTAAILSGKPLDWGNLIYSVTAEVSVTVPGAINWRSSGAKIVMNSAGAVRSVLRLAVGPYSHRIEGDFNVDANLKAYTAFYCENSTGSTFPSDYSDFFADGLRTRNCYRSGTTFFGGDGIHLRGVWRLIEAVRPVAENCRMAAGAGVSGEHGIAGITFSGNSSGDPVNINVVDPYIAGVLSEDGTYTDDQDGLRVIVTPSELAPYETSVTVQGGTFRNCYGRSIKSQAEHTLVEGVKFVRTQGFARGYGNEEIDFQEGGGSVLNCTAIYNGSAPDQVVMFKTTRQGPNTVPGPVPPAKTLKVSVPYGSIDGLKIAIYGSTTLHEVWSNTVIEGQRQAFRVSNVEVVGTGTLEDVCNFYGGNSGTQYYLLMDNIVAAPTGVFVNCATASGTASGEIKATRCLNLGASAIDFRRSTSGNFRPLLSVSDCIGFNVEDRVDNADTPMGVFQRLQPYTSVGAVGGGLVRSDGFTLADGATYDFPDSGASNSTCLIAVSVGAGNTAQGLFGHSDSGVVALTPEATAFTVGTTSDPGSGNYRLWANGAGARLRNSSGASRSFTVWMLG